MQVAHTRPQPTWKEVYFAALFEQDPKRLLAMLKAAQKAIDERLQEVLSGDAINRRELIELENAKNVILLLESHQQQN